MNAERTTIFLGLDTYSKTGGLQRFNRRVIDALADLREATALPLPVVHLMRDTASDIPAHLGDAVRGFGRDRLKFARASIAAAEHAQFMLVGQLNLLPVAALAKALNPSLRSVLFVHGIEVWNDPYYRRRRFYEPLLLRTMDKVASVSQFTANRMQRHFGVPAGKFVILPNAVDGPVLLPQQRRAGKTLLTVSRLAKHDRGKNVDAVLRAFAKVASRLTTAKLIIVGDGELRPELELLAAALGISNRVSFPGRVTDAQLDTYYLEADAFALPSSKEGFGIVFLEAWKHGLPVICGTEDAAVEVVDHEIDGLAINPSDTDALAKAMETLLTDENKARRLGAAGAQKVSERYLDSVFRKGLFKLLEAGAYENPPHHSERRPRTGRSSRGPAA